MLELRNVNTFYGNIQALRDVNIRINEGEIVTLIGANGAGKSTTLMTICGGTPPRSGEVLFRQLLFIITLQKAVFYTVLFVSNYCFQIYILDTFKNVALNKRICLF